MADDLKEALTKVRTMPDLIMFMHIPLIAWMKTEDTNVLQITDPRTGKYVKINYKGKYLLVRHKKTSGPYKYIPVLPWDVVFEDDVFIRGYTIMDKDIRVTPQSYGIRLNL